MSQPSPQWTADRQAASKQIAWLDKRLKELSQTIQHAQQKFNRLSEAGTDSYGLIDINTELRELDHDYHLVENERRHVQRRINLMEKKEKERADQEEAKRIKNYHRLAAIKRASIMAGNSGVSGGSGGGGGRPTHQKRPSVFEPTFIAGFDPNAVAAVGDAAVLRDLNFDSTLDQEIYLERLASKTQRENVFEQQFGKLHRDSIVGASNQRPIQPRAKPVAPKQLQQRGSKRPSVQPQFMIKVDQVSSSSESTSSSSDSDSDHSPTTDTTHSSSASSFLHPHHPHSHQEEKESLSPFQRRPRFLAQAAELSASNLSSSVQNYLTQSRTTNSITATEALIDPHLREKISKTLHDYINAATSSSDHSFTTSTPSREEELLWGLLMGTLKSEEEENLAIEWWKDREQQLVAQAQQARASRKMEGISENRGQTNTGSSAYPSSRRPSSIQPALMNHLSPNSSPHNSPYPSNPNQLLALPGSYPSSYLQSRSPTQSQSRGSIMMQQQPRPSFSQPRPSMSLKHASRGAILNELSIAQEELRQLKCGMNIMQSTLKQRLEEEHLQQLQKIHGRGIGSPVHQFQPSSPSSIEPMCRRFVLSLVSSALSNAVILARQDTIIRDLKFAIAKTKKIQELTANGSINRPAYLRSSWISSVSQPTIMPKLSSEPSVVRFLSVEPEVAKIVPIHPSVAMNQPPSASFPRDEGSNVESSSDESDSSSDDGNESDLNSNSSLISSQPSTSQAAAASSLTTEVRTGRGFIDPFYTPQPFDEERAKQARAKGLTVVYPPEPVVEQRKVMKLPRSLFGETVQENGLPIELSEDAETREANETWLRLQQSKTLATMNTRALFRKHSMSSMMGGDDGGRISIPLEDPSLLGSPPPLYVAPSISEEWNLFCKELDQAHLADRTKGVMTASQPITSAPSKDPTNKTKATPPTPAEVFAAGATTQANPMVDIPKKFLPRGSYHGCTPAHPHPDREADVNGMIQAKSRALFLRAKRLAAAGEPAVVDVLQATRQAFQTHFHPSSNSYDWIPIDPTRPARKCVEGCRGHYQMDATTGMMVANPLGSSHHHHHHHHQSYDDDHSPSPRLPTRPASAVSGHKAAATSGTSTIKPQPPPRPATAQPPRPPPSSTNSHHPPPQPIARPPSYVPVARSSRKKPVSRLKLLNGNYINY